MRIIGLRPKTPPSISMRVSGTGGFVIVVTNPGEPMHGLELAFTFAAGLGFVRHATDILTKKKAEVLAGRTGDMQPGINIDPNINHGFDLVYVAEGHAAHGARIEFDRSTSISLCRVAASMLGVAQPEIAE